MKVIIESPYSGYTKIDVNINIDYARRCLWDSLLRGEAPFASHLLYTQVLDDQSPIQRELGMDRSLQWYKNADLVAVYIDFGISSGMKRGVEHAESIGIPIEERLINDPKDGTQQLRESFKSNWGSEVENPWWDAGEPREHCPTVERLPIQQKDSNGRGRSEHDGATENSQKKAG